MIEFKCHCRQTIQTPDDEAGGMIQCPRCGRLNDVPSLSDLRNLDAEGGFKLSELEVVDEPARLNRVAKAFTRERKSGSGDEIDLRPTLDDVARAGVDEVPLTDDRAIGETPRYDPITGELIVPLTVRQDVAEGAGGAIPVATAVVGYATRDTQDHRPPVALALFSPANMLVMICVFMVYMLYAILTLFFAPFARIFEIGSFWFGLLLCGPMVMAHYVNVINEVAFEDRDELPRFLRNASWSEDIWLPLVQFLLATAYAFGPLMIWLRIAGVTAEGDMVALPLLVAGAMVFPAALLTMSSSGSLPNARPDRLLSVIAAAPARYAWLAGVSLVACLLSLVVVGGFGAIPLHTVHEFYRLHTPPGWVAVPIVLLQLYLAHYGVWHLGLLHREHHKRFRWVNQAHVRQNRTAQPPRRPARRPAGGSGVKSKV